MKKFALLITYVYAFCCPLEFILNRLFGSSVKFVAAAAVIVTACYFLVEQKHVLKFTAFQFCLIGWAGLEALSILWTKQTSATNSHILSYMMMTAFVLLLSFFPFTKKEVDMLIKFYSLGALILAITVVAAGEITTFVHGGRMTISVLGKRQDPNGLAALLLSSIFYSLYKAFEVKKFFIPYFAAFLVQLVAFFYTGSRGGLVALIIALIAFVAVKVPRKRRLVIVLGVITVVVVGYFVLEATLPERLFERLFNVSEYFGSGGQGRIRTWRLAIKELVKSPIFGLGATSYFYYFLQSIGLEVAMHNTFLCVAFEVGLVGLVLFIVPFLSVSKTALKQKNALMIAIITANIVAAFFIDALYVRFLWNALIFGIVYKNSLESKFDEITQNRKEHDKQRKSKGISVVEKA